MATVKIIDPVSRIEGHMKIEVTLELVSGVQQVVDARASGTMFRGFELILKGRPPMDASYITQRVCGVCPVSHGIAASSALDNAQHISIPTQGRLLRNIILGANFVQSHVLHFYHLALLDFVAGPSKGPWQPSWTADHNRLSGTDAHALMDHYITALTIRRQAHELAALFGGKMPHPSSIVPGGCTATPQSDRITAARMLLLQILPFLENVYLSDLQRLMQTYSDYYTIGDGYGNLLAFGGFDLDATGNNRLFRRGRLTASQTGIQSVNLDAITESITYGWYADSDKTKNPATASTTPQPGKATGYSWIKAPRYESLPYEVGPLARMMVNGDYTRGISVADRHLARANEAIKIAQQIGRWLDQLSPSGRTFTAPGKFSTASGVGLAEAPRGALGHWVQIAEGTISSYQIVTPTCWNASPRDERNALGPIEKALIGSPVQNADEPVEVTRVIHSFDPCLACAVHVFRPGSKGVVQRLPFG